jgi:hypothetical protein
MTARRTELQHAIGWSRFARFHDGHRRAVVVARYADCGACEIRRRERALGDLDADDARHRCDVADASGQTQGRGEVVVPRTFWYGDVQASRVAFSNSNALSCASRRAWRGRRGHISWSRRRTHESGSACRGVEALRGASGRRTRKDETKSPAATASSATTHSCCSSRAAEQTTFPEPNVARTPWLGLSAGSPYPCTHR